MVYYIRYSSLQSKLKKLKISWVVEFVVIKIAPWLWQQPDGFVVGSVVI